MLPYLPHKPNVMKTTNLAGGVHQNYLEKLVLSSLGRHDLYFRPIFALL